jgi:hypothetical protein
MIILVRASITYVTGHNECLKANLSIFSGQDRIGAEAGTKHRTAPDISAVSFNLYCRCRSNLCRSTV